MVKTNIGITLIQLQPAKVFSGMWGLYDVHYSCKEELLKRHMCTDAPLMEEFFMLKYAAYFSLGRVTDSLEGSVCFLL